MRFDRRAIILLTVVPIICVPESMGRLINFAISDKLPLFDELTRILAAAVLDGSSDAVQYGFVGELEGINDLKKRGNVVQTSGLNFAGEVRHIKQSALVGPAPVRVALEIGVLQMEGADRVPEAIQPFGHSRMRAIERPI